MLFAKVLKYEGDNKTFVWKYPIEDFNTGSQLIVHQSQEAVFFQNGKMLDMFGPGRHTLRTENLPIITNLMNLATGGRNAFHCELYFINKTEQMAIPWGTDSKIQYLDPVYQFPIELGACGEMSIALENAGKVLVKIVGNEKKLTQEQLGEKLRVFVMKYAKSVIPRMIQAQKISIFDLDMYLTELADEVKYPLTEEFKDYGFDLRKFSIMRILKPDEDPNYIKFKQLHYKSVNDVREAEIRQRVGIIDAQTAAQKKVIDAEALARKRMMEGFTYQQEKAFDVAERIAVIYLLRGISANLWHLEAETYVAAVCGYRNGGAEAQDIHLAVCVVVRLRNSLRQQVAVATFWQRTAYPHLHIADAVRSESEAYTLQLPTVRDGIVGGHTYGSVVGLRYTIACGKSRGCILRIIGPP